MMRSPEARSRARQVLELVGIIQPPVDVNAVAGFLGFTVLPYAFPDSTAAVTFIEGAVKTIGVNSAYAPVRQRFSVAHELGHYLCGHDAHEQDKTHVENRPTYLDPQNRQEVEADEFAAELLMPSPFLRRDLAQLGLDVPTLAKRYQVSEQAMWVQLIDRKLARQYAKR